MTNKFLTFLTYDKCVINENYHITASTELKKFPAILDKTPEDSYTKVKMKLITPQKRRTAMTQNTITYYNLTDIYGEQVVLGV